MPRSQLAINCPQALLERLRSAAQQQHTTVTALVLGWLEAGLDGRLDAPRSASSSDLDQRLAAVEQRLGALQEWEAKQRTDGAPSGNQNAAREKTTSSDTGSCLRDSAKVLTTAELADHLELKRGGLNMRLRRHNAGLGYELEGWRIIGKAKPARGGPEQWQWQAI